MSLVSWGIYCLCCNVGPPSTTLTQLYCKTPAERLVLAGVNLLIWIINETILAL